MIIFLEPLSRTLEWRIQRILEWWTLRSFSKLTSRSTWRRTKTGAFLAANAWNPRRRIFSTSIHRIWGQTTMWSTVSSILMLSHRFSTLTRKDLIWRCPTRCSVTLHQHFKLSSSLLKSSLERVLNKKPITLRLIILASSELLLTIRLTKTGELIQQWSQPSSNRMLLMSNFRRRPHITKHSQAGKSKCLNLW